MAKNMAPAVLDLPESPSMEVISEIGELRELPLVSLRESPWNPRTYFSAEGLTELAESIRGKGITTPLIVRPTSDGFEIGAGARRYRAAKIAGLNRVPCVVRVLDDNAFLELICFENRQREDPHPLDEAAGFRMYMKQTHCNADEVAHKNGISRSQVYARLKMAEGLIPEARQACWDGKITAGHAVLIARLQVKEQEKALKYCTANDYRGNVSVRDLQQWIEDDICLEMAKAPFDLSDATLVPSELHGNRTIEGPGACTDCPKRTLNSPDLFPELQPGQVKVDAIVEPGKKPEKYDLHTAKSADVCTDPGCFHRKLKAHLVKIEAKAKEQHGEELVKITTGHAGKKDMLGTQQWERVDKKAAGPNIKMALVVHEDRYARAGVKLGEVIRIKIKPKPKAAPQHDWEAENRKRDEQVRRQKAIRRKVLEAVLAKVTSIDRDDLVHLITRTIEDSQGAGVEALAECLGVPKNGLIKQLPKWHGKELGRVIVGCSVVGELSGWHDAPDLLAAAKRYKVDAQKIRNGMEAEFKQQEQAAKNPENAAKSDAPTVKKAPAKKIKGPALTAAARRRIAAAQKQRWALHRKQQAKKAGGKA